MAEDRSEPDGGRVRRDEEMEVSEVWREFSK